MQYKIKRTMLNNELAYQIENLETGKIVDIFYVEYGKDVPVIERALINAIVDEFKSKYGSGELRYDKTNFRVRLSVLLGLSIEDTPDGTSIIRTSTFDPIRECYMQLRYTEFSTALYIMKRTVSEKSLNTTFNLLLNKDVKELSPKVKEVFEKACSKIKNETDEQKIFRDIAFLASAREYKEGLSNCNLTNSMIKEIDNVLTEENL